MQSRRTLAMALILAATGTGCGYLRMLCREGKLEQEYAEQPSLRLLQQLAPEDTFHVRGAVDGADATPLLVAAVSSTLRLDELVATRLVRPRQQEGSSRGFSLLLPPGNYDFFVFADLDRDGVFRRGELVGRTPLAGFTKVDAKHATDGFSVPGPRLAVDVLQPRDCGFGFEAEAAASGPIFEDLEHPFFDAKWGRLGEYRPLELFKHTQGLLFGLEDHDPAKAQVVFVHGASGTPRDFEHLVAGLDRDRFQPWFVYYPSGLPLEKTSRMVAGVVRGFATNPATRSARVILVAHSMGGLVTRQALNHLCEGGRAPPWLRGYVSFAAAYGGNDMARAGSEYAPDVVPSWRDVATGSAFIEAAHATPLPEGLPFYLFFAWGKGLTRGPGAAGDGTIALRSQLDPRVQPLATRLLGYEQTHLGILRDEEARASFHEVLEGMAGR